MDGSLFALIRGRIADPDADFLVEADGTRLSYGGMLDRSGRLANLFVRLGVRPGDRIAIQAEKSAWALIVYLATLRVGAVHLPLNPAYTPAEVRYFLGDAEPALFVCRPGQEAEMRALAAELGVPRVETLGADGGGSLAAAALEQPAEFDDAPRDADDLAAILYTSGTTGRSKGAMLTHRNLASNAETLRIAWRFTAADRLLHALPIFHTHGLFVATNVSLLAGGSMLFLPGFDLDAILRLLPHATAMMGVPTYYTRLLARPDFTRELAAHMRLFVSGSAPLSAETHREFEARTDHRILERYGMTETNMICSNPYDGPRIPGSVGRALPGVAVRIAAPESGRVLPEGEVGIIEVRGPNIFKGYWRMPEKTAEEFRPDGHFITGDMAWMDEAGYVRIVGRARDLVISGGLNVYPAEVEAAIEELPGVAECAVIGVPHPDFGEGVVAVVTARPGEPTPDEANIRAALRDRLAAFKQPKRVFLIDALPRNTMGKIQKNALRERYAETFTP
ncbi:MAG TPA: malonyl-CoA synthase [Allosphingosinicella sp.]|jgi:malonyl-CoA/methylmalonyl-CoA synthetase